MSYILKLHVADEDLDAAVDLLSDLAPWGWEEVAKRGGCDLRVHVEDRKQFKQLQRRIRRVWPEAKLDADKVKDADWQTAWQFFFQPVKVADTFCILPPWKLEEAGDDSLTPLIIHPKMAFGTGHHPTTILCLQALVHVKEQDLWPTGGHILDVGTGSGILAIAAAHLGCTGVAMDIDPVAMDNARENVWANKVEDRVSLLCGDMPCVRSGRGYPLVVANILAGPLIRMASDLVGCVQEQGTLILSGVLTSQVDSVRQAYEVLGLGTPQVEHLGEWASLTWLGHGRE
ncbi:MAG: 50S ribosomal protein L11 methyltransferase [Desulfovermiculus sp.]